MPVTRPGLKVLVVEDDPDGADSLAMFLGLHGHHVRVAHTGPAGVAAALADPPDAVVCDLHLPGLSGLDVARRVAALPSRPLLVALTARYGEGWRPRRGGPGLTTTSRSPWILTSCSTRWTPTAAGSRPGGS
jgi:CheY-like chemotaxis protein